MHVIINKCPKCFDNLDFSKAYISKGAILINCKKCTIAVEIDKAKCMHKGCNEQATFLYQSESISYHAINWSTYCEKHQKKFPIFRDVKVEQELNRFIGKCAICQELIDGIEIVGPLAIREAVFKIGEEFPNISDVSVIVKNMHKKCKKCNTLYHKKCCKRLKGYSFWKGTSKVECVECKELLTADNYSIIYGIF